MEANPSKQFLTPMEFIQEQVCSPVTSEMSLDELGMDSLELINLQLECQEQFGKRIPDAKQAELHTVGDLANFFG